VITPASLSLAPEVVPDDHSRQVIAEDYVVDGGLARWTGRAAAPRVLDLGCGAGDSVDLFRAVAPEVRWVGLDVPGSPEAVGRTRTDAELAEFDGVSIPFSDGEFNLVYCKQVLEHVRHPEPLLAEVARVLAPGGHLVGSTSQLEPYHSLSLWNYTPYGLAVLLRDAGLEVVELRPSVDALTLLARRALRYPRWFDRFWSGESPLNRALTLGGRVMRRDHRTVNAAKLALCGQFCFAARAGAG
jgi:SAM-dependent methyltransferase